MSNDRKQSFSDRLTPGQIQTILNALGLPYNQHLRKDGIWADIPSDVATDAGFYVDSDLSVNIETGGWQDQYKAGHPNPDEGEGMRIRGDIVQLFAMFHWERADREYEKKAIKQIRNLLDMNNTKTDVHSFNIADAQTFGVECAVLLYNIRFWLKRNKANNRNIHDGRVWTYNSRKAFADLFPYLSEDQIYRRLKTLEDEGKLLTGNYNEHKYDRTKWYTIDEPAYMS